MIGAPSAFARGHDCARPQARDSQTHEAAYRREKHQEETMFQQALEKVSKQVLIRDRYGNFIGGKWVPPVEGRYFDNPSPITGKKLCEIPRSTAADVELALDAAHKAKEKWSTTSVQERSRILNKIADKLEANLDLLALVGQFDNGKAVLGDI